MLDNPKTTLAGYVLWVMALGWIAYQAVNHQLTWNDVVMAAGFAGAGTASISSKDGGH